MLRSSVLPAVMLLAAACSSAKPAASLDFRQCNAIAAKSGITLDVLAVSHATKPIARAIVNVDFGAAPATGKVAFTPPLLPGDSRDVPVKLDSASNTRQPPRRCVAGAVTYADGSSD